MESRSERFDIHSRHITVNTVQPGSTNTDMNLEDGEYANFQRALIPLGRYGQPEDVAAAVAYLASPAARQITGTILTVDGGAELTSVERFSCAERRTSLVLIPNRGSYFGARSFSTIGNFVAPTLGGAMLGSLGGPGIFLLFAGFSS